MKTKTLLMTVIVVTIVLMFAAPAMAGQVTRLFYGLENIDYYSYTPTTTGSLDIEISWTNPDGTGAPVYPVAEIDGVVQTYDAASKEDYFDIDVASLYEGTNPEVGTYAVKTAFVNKPVYIGVIPYIGDVPYRLVVKFNNVSVIDTGVINVASLTQKWAYACSGEVNVPSTSGLWRSVMQYWPGTLNRATAASDVYANWDDYVFERDPAGAGEMANAWVVDANSYKPPLATETALTATNGNRWYVVAPEIWTGAARPNVWTALATDLYPKPGSLTTSQAPLWYTYSWPDAGKADAPGYMEGNTNSVKASGHAFSSLNNTNATATFTFFGTSVKWVYTTGPAAGIAKVTIDGGTPTTVDQYSATAQFKQSTTYSGLTNAAHTIVVQSNKTKNTASTNFVTYHDAFVATGFTGDTTTLCENGTDGSTTYAWGRVNNANAHGGSFSQEHTTTAATAFTFTGGAIDYIYTKSANGGIARVYIDGVDKGTVDEYSAAVVWQASSTFSGLGAGQHTIMIVNNKTKNAASGNFMVYLDAFKVGTTYYEN